MNNILKWLLILGNVTFIIFIIIPFTEGVLSRISSKESVEITKGVNKGVGKDKVNLEFGKVEDISYIFYYPKDYVESDVKGNIEELNFENKNSQAIEFERISLLIDSSTRRPPTPTYEMCKRGSEAYRFKEDDRITAELVFDGLAKGKGVGCKTVAISSINGVNDASVIVEKTLWYDGGDDFSVYTARATYFENASSKEAEQINFAVDQFTLK